MASGETAGGLTFKDMEQAGWHEKASEYDALPGQITTQAMEALLDAALVQKGTRLLDFACGPGYGAGAAAARGAVALGIDFAQAMVDEATARFPDAEFQIDDAESLTLEDNLFDAVICPFGLLHMADPEKAVQEACRVLKVGGRYAFSAWETPETHQFFAVVLPAVQAHATTEVPLPPAPPIFRFSDPEECKKVLEDAGFADTGVEHVQAIWKPSSAQQVLDMVHKGTLRTAELLRHQTPDALERIHRDIIEGAEAFKVDGNYNIAWPAVIAWGSKP